MGGLLEMLGLRRSDPDLDGRVVVDCGMTTRVVPPFWVTFGRSWPVVVFMLLESRIFPCPVGDGNCASLKSVEPVSRLLWRSSKLTDGRKSKDEVASPKSVDDAGPFRFDENRGRALVDAGLSIGSSFERRWGDGGVDRFSESRVLQKDKGLVRNKKNQLAHLASFRANNGRVNEHTCEMERCLLALVQRAPYAPQT